MAVRPVFYSEELGPKAMGNILPPGKRLIIASNRGPVQYDLHPDGDISAERGSGGVVTALGALGNLYSLVWLTSAMTEGDREMARRAPSGRLTLSPRNQTAIRFVVSPREAYEKFYTSFTNPLLWLLQHGLWDTVEKRDRHVVLDSWRNGYVPVNQAFAQAISNEAARADAAPIVLLHDYHLYLVAGYLRAARTDLLLQHFVHIPWPDPASWMVLPDEVRVGICEGLCSNDLVGFQTEESASNFLATCAVFLRGAWVDWATGAIRYQGHETRVRTYPVSIDVAAVKAMTTSPRARALVADVLPRSGTQTIMRIDRLDMSKNILRGFEAFSLLLERHPELHGRVRFAAFLVPCREEIPEYRSYARETVTMVETINAKFGYAGWRPIDLFLGNNYARALSAMRFYDVLLVNPVMDGMNLVAKEGPIVNERDGVLLLSTEAGAYQQLKDGVIPIHPLDVNGTAVALCEALRMAPAERRDRALRLKRTIEADDVSLWLRRQLEDLALLCRDEPTPAIAR